MNKRLPRYSTHRVRKLLSSLAITPSLLFTHPTFAYEEVIVTAQKRTENLLDVPIAISVVDAQQLAKHSIKNLTDIAAIAPNFQVSSPNGETIPLFSIRGVSMSDYSVNQSSPIGVYLDEVSLGANYSHGLALFDLERVEILRGPQGSLYGRNTTGGAINLVSKTPNFETEGDLTITAGNYSRKGLQAAYQQPLIGQTLAARIAVDYLEADGYSDNHVVGADDLSAIDKKAMRLSLLYKPTDNIEAILRVNASSSDPKTQAVIPIVINPGSAEVLFYERNGALDNWDAESNKVKTTDVNTRSSSLTLNIQQENLLITSITAYTFGRYSHKADSDGMPVQVLENDWGGKHEQWSQEIRATLNIGDDQVYTLGVYYSEEDIDLHNVFEMYHGLEPFVPFDGSFLLGGLSGATVDQSFSEEKTSQALFAHANYSLTNSIGLTAGIRYTEDKNTQSNYQSYVGDYERNFFTVLLNDIPEDSFTDHEWTGTLKADYSYADNQMLYASYSRGYRSGAFNGAALFSTAELGSVEPETINAFELGAKGLALNNRLRYGTALFHYNYRNQQFLNVVGVLQQLENAKRAEIQGIEFELEYQATPTLSFSSDIAFTDSEYKDGPTLFAQGQERDLTGNKLITTPEINASLYLDHTLTTHTGVLNSHLGLRYISEQWFSAFNDDFGYQDIGQSGGYSIWNARFEFTPKSEKMSFALWGKNLGNKEYKAYALNLSGFGYHYTIAGEPRTFGLDVRLHF